MNLNRNDKFWQIISIKSNQNVTNNKFRDKIERIPIKSISQLPFYVKSNIPVCGLQLRDKQQIFFLPDKVLVADKKNIGFINYKDIEINTENIEFTEEETVPTDTKVLRYEWYKQNKDGSPDSRFKSNYQVPVCEYGKIIIDGGYKLHLELLYSDSSITDDLISG